MKGVPRGGKWKDFNTAWKGYFSDLTMEECREFFRVNSVPVQYHIINEGTHNEYTLLLYDMDTVRSLSVMTQIKSGIVPGIVYNGPKRRTKKTNDLQLELFTKG